MIQYIVFIPHKMTYQCTAAQQVVFKCQLLTIPYSLIMCLLRFIFLFISKKNVNDINWRAKECKFWKKLSSALFNSIFAIIFFIAQDQPNATVLFMIKYKKQALSNIENTWGKGRLFQYIKFKFYCLCLFPNERESF